MPLIWIYSLLTPLRCPNLGIDCIGLPSWKLMLYKSACHVIFIRTCEEHIKWVKEWKQHQELLPLTHTHTKKRSAVYRISMFWHLCWTIIATITAIKRKTRYAWLISPFYDHIQWQSCIFVLFRCIWPMSHSNLSQTDPEFFENWQIDLFNSLGLQWLEWPCSCSIKWTALTDQSHQFVLIVGFQSRNFTEKSMKNVNSVIVYSSSEWASEWLLLRSQITGNFANLL